ncbi:MAG TPA: Fe-S-binding domain-containing protein, partial [Solibacterales bacterium]|nr:Fe-S-binding domain-containing protein [Bryobacterales bacterium]
TAGAILIGVWIARMITRPLTTLVGAVAILCSWTAVEDRLKSYYSMLLLQQTGMLGVFLSLDFLLFYVFW